MRGFNSIVSFEENTGSLRVQAGVLLSEILKSFVPQGFFPPVVPGTKHVTIGGMIAADVHGKNHHVDGGFGGFVEELSLAIPTGEVVRCSAHQNSDLYNATIGGMGLTGTILEATVRLKRIETGWIRQRTIVARGLDEAIQALDVEATYSVAWIDCLAKGASLGRSLVYLGEHAAQGDLGEQNRRGAFPPAARELLALPMRLPDFTSSFLSFRAFNEIYFRRGVMRSHEPSMSEWDRYFFPLDGIGSWNRLYGRRGFLQHQCVIPAKTAISVLPEILGRVAASGNASLLAVLKRLGNSFGTLSFPMPGYTLAMDFPARPDIFPLLDELDSLVVKAGGRLYLAKDARQSRHTFEAGYPGADQFRAVRRSIAADGRLSSHMSLRLGL